MRRTQILGMTAVTCAATTGGSVATAQECEPEWAAMDAPWTALSGAVLALEVFDGGAGEELFVGGHFFWNEYESIVRWDGDRWLRVGSGIPDLAGGGTQVSALAEFDGELYVGGHFLKSAGGKLVGGLVKWDGSQWLPVPGWEEPGDAAAFAVFDDGSGPALYVGGGFTLELPGGDTAEGIARWDGARWSALGAHDVAVNALAVFDDGSGPSLYAGGEFPIAGGEANIARWDGAQWTPLGDGIDGAVYDLTVFDGGSGPALYVCGKFTEAGGQPANGIARWDGAEWAPVGDPGLSGFLMSVLTLAAFDDGSGEALYAGGYNIESADGVRVNSIAKWDGSQWAPLAGPGGEAGVAGGGINSMAASEGGPLGRALYVGGSFQSTGGQSAQKIAAWRGCELCYADCDGSGELDFFDFLCFQNTFAAMEPYADCDESGSLDFFDFLCFQNEFAAGCP